jgi:hypothetical protein
MKSTFWLLLFAFAAVAAWLVWFGLRKWQARQRAEEERIARFIAAAGGVAPPNPGAALAVPPPAASAAPLPAASIELSRQKLLFEAAHKAGEAGEPALAIQLYARLLARYPATGFANEARAAVEALKKKLVKA